MTFIAASPDETARQVGPATRRRRTAREPAAAPATPVAITHGTAGPTKLVILEALLARAEGASVEAMTEATGWQRHSVRGALSEALKQRGLLVTSQKLGDERIYRASRAKP